MPRFRSSNATDSSCSWEEDADEEEDDDEDDEEDDEADDEDGDELGGDEDDEASVGLHTFIDDVTAAVENDENIGLPTIVALFTSLALASFECLLSS